VLSRILAISCLTLASVTGANPQALPKSLSESGDIIRFAEEAVSDTNPKPATKAFGRGILSGAAKLCGADWQNRNFLPMMKFWRHEKKHPEDQLAILAAMHGAGMGWLIDAAKSPQCDEKLKRYVGQRLNFVP
jgi:hypothetical protein